MEISRQTTVLGKRKAGRKAENLILHLTSPSSSSSFLPEQSDSELSAAQPSTSARPPILINGSLVPHTKKRYRCTHEGCGKAYSKPSRLEEHERSHTGQRPFVCETCGKSYLRETHLHAHIRSHLPASMKPFVCDRDGCVKRFWTAQHLQAHHSWHEGAKPYKCQEQDCDQAFSKHHLLRAHICSTHAPPGTKPYRCDHDSCTKSFDTNQHFRTHQKTHDSKRYTCVLPACLGAPGHAPAYFQTWSALQSHIRTAHPPTCPHPTCNGRAFSNHGNLRAHLKLHEQREIEVVLQDGLDSEGEAENTPRKRRRGGEIGRDWKCEKDNCDKDFKSKKALQTHINVTHLGKRDFACHYSDCTHAFGYKHLLQRHVAKAHPEERPCSAADVSEDSSTEEEDHNEDANDEFDIDMITGNAYTKKAETSLKSRKALCCPHPALGDLLGGTSETAEGATSQGGCDYVFTRGYDLRRHLESTHKVQIGKEGVNHWVNRQKKTRLA